MSKDMTVLITYPRTFYSGINSETTHITFVDLRVANEIARSEDTIICYIRAGVLIPRVSPKASAQVIHPFSIQLSLTEEGYVATSPLCNIYEIEKTKRKSNAIENVFIPRLQGAVKFIIFRLAEMERDTFIMLKTVKRKMGEREQENIKREKEILAS